MGGAHWTLTTYKLWRATSEGWEAWTLVQVMEDCEGWDGFSYTLVQVMESSK